MHAPFYHPAHGEYAKGVGALFFSLGKYYPNYGDDKTNKLKRIYLWLKLTIDFPYKKFDAILTDEPFFIAILLKILSFGRLQLIATQDAQTTSRYFDGKLNWSTRKLVEIAYNNYDIIICIGSIQLDMVKKLCTNNNKTKIVECFNGVREERIGKLLEVNYSVSSNKIFSLSSWPSQDMFEWKGVDIMLALFNRLSKRFSNLEYHLIGNHLETIIIKIKADNPNYPWDRIHFLGKQKEIDSFFNDAICLLHLSRREAWGIAVSESAMAGIPTFISDNVGAKTMYAGLEDRDKFIIQNNQIDEAERKLISFLESQEKEKFRISELFRKISRSYKQTDSIKSFRQNILANSTTNKL